MKRLVGIVLLVAGLGAVPCRAQFTSDLIQQLLLDVEKLQDMKSILKDMVKGYEILDKSYTKIRNVAQGRYNLHKLFLDGLLAVSPAVKDYHRVATILDNAYQLVKTSKAAAGRAHSSGLFSGSELDYLDGMFSMLFNRSLQSIEELTMVLTEGRLRMDDAQRLRTIDRVYREVEGELGAVRQLNGETAVQMMQRQKEKNELKILKRLYGDP